MIKIKLPCGRKTIIDSEDLEIVSRYKWSIAGKHPHCYARAHYGYKNGKQIYTKLHNLLLNPPDGMVVDHVNGNTLDNRRSNLRVCSQSQNMRNRKVHKNNKIGVKGINKRKNGKYQARIRINKKLIHLGSFRSLDLAIAAYNDASGKFHKSFGKKSERKK